MGPTSHFASKKYPNKKLNPENNNMFVENFGENLLVNVSFNVYFSFNSRFLLSNYLNCFCSLRIFFTFFPSFGLKLYDLSMRP